MTTSSTMRAVFQFHIGSIKSRVRVNPFLFGIGFNSTLVQLKEPVGLLQKRLFAVSIPHWFN